ncbi:ArsR/SmtB family transcription factor [Paenibacillus agri]|uniref:ArsR family transcriptional regulator n=1 Tax=Paenibacillus agri TaxID=2744309 RepID=A0A850EWR7_9BACL|nr:ArsR family transcriptional regulator [Paenibacillus agri]NUU64089.1 ArsR family transcriptional regulator [Paenibacillus agri]
MYLTTDTQSLRVYEALASEVRLRIVDLLGEREMHIKELAAELHLSSAIVSSHVVKLQKAGIVSSKMRRIDGGTYKYCSLSANYFLVKLTGASAVARKVVEVSVPVGHYTDLQVAPGCGIMGTDKVVGYCDDDARRFRDPCHADTSVLWLDKGYVEYKVPNYLFRDIAVQEIEISMEIGSEASHVNEKWPTDIIFTLNDRDLGRWTGPGESSKLRNSLTADYWKNEVNRRGLLKVLRINASGTFMDGQQISEVTLADICWHHEQWTFRVTAAEVNRRRGRLALYGCGSGNYEQDIVFRVYSE